MRGGACLECRLSKVRCAPSSSCAAPCQRCQRHGFECQFEQARKRGPKARSKVLSQRGPSAGRAERADVAHAHARQASPGRSGMNAGAGAGAGEAAVVSRASNNASARPASDSMHAWNALARSTAQRGSTYTFVSAGENLDGSTIKSRVGPGPPTLRGLLARIDNKQQLQQQQQRPRTPQRVTLLADVDACEAGIIGVDEGRRLFAYYLDWMEPWVSVLDGARQDHDAVKRSSALLYSTIVFLAARFCEHSRRTELGLHARSLAAACFAHADVGLDTALALYLLATWKDVDDGFSDVYTAHAARIMSISASQLSSSSAPRDHQRLFLFYIVQHHSFLLHYVASPTFVDLGHGLVKRCVEWCLAPDAMPSDWFLGSDVESTALQCRYKDLIEAAAGSASAIASLLAAFLQEVDAWQQRWSSLAQQREPSAADGSRSYGQQVRRAGHEMFRSSFCMHVTSNALRTLLKASRGGGASSSLSSSAAVEEAKRRSYAVSLEAATRLLAEVASMDRQVIVHMPDPIMVLSAHAALLAVYLVLLPLVVPHLVVFIDVAPHEAASRRDEVLDLVAAAARALSDTRAIEGATTLCADYLESLLGLFSPPAASSSSSQSSQPSTSLFPASTTALATLAGAAGPPPPHPPPSSGDVVVTASDWDWLQAFLDLPEAPMFR
ncbi:hypothetical protein FA10DRAFT_263415 [Acaromyces ingoldii]|uniref:Zn(2)-C6 fungal-type domain-containing protein n=1 Tax=Acaromyces ingoldii TaxID=215250 RepID=A0A316YTB6_9BASI|nr:hypothetical protein FA10DRAFT_263415 [Acaromyces ingoldii]PWN92647.1 hypothetical protein FA10DRAFT_263415 [Acaromyces ingoldii]